MKKLYEKNETAFAEWRRTQEQNFETWEGNQESDFETWSTNQKSTFEAWVDSIRDILDSSTAGHLQLEIDNAEINDLLDHGFASSITTINGYTITETEQITEGGVTTAGRSIVTQTSQAGGIKTITSVLYSALGAEVARAVTTVNGSTITTVQTRV